MDPGRRAHYGDFYSPVPGAGPVALVHGNCQAEALRVLLAPALDPVARTVRMPPAHELTAADLPYLGRLLARTSVLLTQPIRDDYRDLPIGSGQLAAALPGGARHRCWPVIRYHGLTPYSAIVRHPSDPAAVPPVVPYHDLRTLARAAGCSGVPRHHGATLRACAAASVAELARRERASGAVPVSDVLAGAGVDAMHTLNHPTNGNLTTLAERILGELGIDGPAPDPGRVLLGGIRAPCAAVVLRALGLTAEPREHWLVDGVALDDEPIERAHLAWYRDHPQWVAAGLSRHRDRMATLGL